MISGMLAWVEGADGVKSGFTEQAGKTLVFSAVRDGQRVYVVTMNSRKLEGETAELTEWAFGNFDWHAPVYVQNQPAAPAAAVAAPDTSSTIIEAALEGSAR
jgi:D-alanyl-D-alanine carboxypeptidase